MVMLSLQQPVLVSQLWMPAVTTSMNVSCIKQRPNQIESKRLAECIYNKGCEADAEIAVIPAYVGIEGTLNISDDSMCSEIAKTFWTNIVIGDNLCNAESITSISIDQYNYLESFVVGSQSLQNVVSVSFSRNPVFAKFTVGSNSLNLVESLAFTKNPAFIEFIIENNVFTAVTYLSVEGILSYIYS